MKLCFCQVFVYVPKYLLFITHCNSGYVVSGNIDQVQYCDKVNNVADFLGAKLSQDELTKIWKMQVGQEVM